MTRIVAGLAGSLSLAVPKSGTRPTSDRVREAMFSSLEAMDALRGTHVLDLYAGSGALALEAVSRGASSAVLVEQSAQAAAVCRANAAAVAEAVGKTRAVGKVGRAEKAERVQIAGTDIRPRIDVRQSSVRSYLAATGSGDVDLAFLDPPYDVDDDELSAVLTALVPHLSPDAVVVVERSTRSHEPSWPESLEPFRSKTYGETAVWFAQPAAPSQPE